jgi:hypothetical protein
MFIEALESRRLFSVVTLTANTAQVLTLQSGETLNGNGHTVGGVTGLNVSSVTIENLVVSGKKGSGSGITIESTQAGISGLTMGNITVSGFTSGYGIFIETAGNGTLSNVNLSLIAAFNNGDAGIATYGATGSITNFQLNNSSAYNNPGIAGSNSPSGSGIMLAGLNGATVNSCAAYNNGANNNAASGPVGIFTYNSNAVTIESCYSYHNKTRYHDGGGFDLDGGVTNSQIINCYAWGNAGYGYAAFTYAGGTANSGNSFTGDNSTDDLEGFLDWSNGPTISNLTVTGNSFVDPTSGNAVVAGAGSAYVNIDIANNTIVL